MTDFEITDNGMENFCIGIFGQAKEEYYKAMDTVLDDNATKKAKTYAKMKINRMEKQFASGKMDIFTDIYDSLDSKAIWDLIVATYKKERNVA